MRKNYLRWSLAWILYGVGHVTYTVVNCHPDTDEEPSFVWYWLYNIYNWCMTRSLSIQGPGKFGPWNQFEHEY